MDLDDKITHNFHSTIKLLEKHNQLIDAHSKLIFKKIFEIEYNIMKMNGALHRIEKALNTHKRSFLSFITALFK